MMQASSHSGCLSERRLLLQSILISLIPDGPPLTVIYSHTTTLATSSHYIKGNWLTYTAHTKQYIYIIKVDSIEF